MSATGRIVLFGASGYTGRLTTASLVARGERPLLVARSAPALERLAADHGGLDTAVADVTRPDSLRALLSSGDVLVSTVGPFVRYGPVAVEAAIEAGCHYIDSTGEPAWIRQVFERYGPRAAARDCMLMTAVGYDYVPGNLAAALALERAADATRVDVGYFVSGDLSLRKGLSSGTLASLGEAVLDPGFALRGGRLVEERGARRVRRFAVDGRHASGVSIGMSEHFALPRIYPRVTEVNTYLGWFGPASRAMQAASAANAVLARVPGVLHAQRAFVRRLLRGSRGGPDAAARARTVTLVVAEAFDVRGRPAGRITLRGASPYELTGDLLAWAATAALSTGPAVSGAVGPAEAFGLQALERGCADAGLTEASQQ